MSGVLLSQLTINIASSIDSTVRERWRKCPIENPFLLLEFHEALEESKAVGEYSGWHPLYIMIESEALEGLIIAYVKQHSYGEYVFDWQWAEAYQGYGLNYYPKLCAAIPFTPVTVDKFVFNRTPDAQLLVHLLTEVSQQLKLSGWHYLFSGKCLENDTFDERIYTRFTMAYRWENAGWSDFDQFLQSLTQKHRKSIKRERRHIASMALRLSTLEGHEVTEDILQAFYACYQNTYIVRGQRPYLPLSFFQKVFSSMPDSLMLCCAFEGEDLVACSLFFKSDTTLYGRYWGAKKEINFLHFELCYYQGISYAIKNHMDYFDPGTQGEHKAKRGFKPRLVKSFHYLNDCDLHEPVLDFCRQEQGYQMEKLESLTHSLPFKS